MSPLRNVALVAVLLALGCSSTDPPESALNRPEQRTAPTNTRDATNTTNTRDTTAAPGDAGVADAEPAATSSPSSPARDAAADAAGDSAGDSDLAQTETGPDEPKKADKPAAQENKPRDLKVLPRSWSLARVEKYMKSEVERGLGVDCGFCHDKYDYAADHARKDVARRMMRMTNDLNRQYFKGQSKITCYSCHKGKKAP